MTSESSEYVDDRVLAARTPISRITWQVMRQRGGGPPFSKIGRRCVYRWADVVAWIEARRTVGGK
ncbi:MAG: helix-turn-helix domain-containing protein [Kofleriaceae bacterium]|nr:MAG: helix-turn-helix domain-containing protein [Kofleriaceae bacterium]